MDGYEILDVVLEHKLEWADEEIGYFVRRALTEDITLELLEKDMRTKDRR